MPCPAQPLESFSESIVETRNGYRAGRRHAVDAHHFVHHMVVALLGAGQWGLRAIDRGPLLGEKGEELLLAGDAFDSDRVDVDEVQSRKESLGTPRVRSSVFRQQGFAEALLGRNIADGIAWLKATTLR